MTDETEHTRGSSIVECVPSSPRKDGGSTPTLSLQCVDVKTAQEFLAQYHYLGTKKFRSAHRWGLYKGQELKGVIVFHHVSALETIVGAFGLPRSEHTGVWELGRLALSSDTNGGNVGSFFVSRAIKLLHKKTPVRAIISYADSSRHVGSIYQACNFTYAGLSAQKNDFYVHGNIQERGKTTGVVGGEWRPRPRKHRYVLIFDESLSLHWPVEKYPKK